MYLSENKTRQGLINPSDDVGPSYEHVESAWKEKKYDKVLSLLQKDSVFPLEFKFENLSYEGEEGHLKKFAERRLCLHEAIRKGDLNEVERLTFKKESKFYLSPEDQSAAYKAIECKQFHIYSYLKTIGVRFQKGEEQVMEKLDDAEKKNLQEFLDINTPETAQNIITNLKAKSKSPNPPKDFDEKLELYYEKLNTKIPEILQIVKCENDLIIQFDFDCRSAVEISGISGARGLVSIERKKICIGCNRDENEILGTLAHELTHLAMEIVFENDCKPYEKSDKKDGNIFKLIIEGIKGQLRGIIHPAAKIITDAFNLYAENEHHIELIVRIPHILAQFENSDIWLETNFPEFWIYYHHNVLSKCKEFINQIKLKKPKSLIRNFNEKNGKKLLGEKNSCLFFKNLSGLKDFLIRQNISFLFTKNSRLGLFRILQALYHEKYDTYDNFIVLNFEYCFHNLDEVKVAFFSEVTTSMIVECQSIEKQNLKDLLKTLITWIPWKINKKIIFVVRENPEKIIYEIAKEKSFQCGLKIDDNFCLADLKQRSLKKILKTKIFFQGVEITLLEMIEDEEFFKYFDGNIIGLLLENENFEVGSRVFGISSLEGPYAQIHEKLNITSLLKEIEKKDAVFVFSGKKNVIITKLSLEDSQIDEINLKGPVEKGLHWTKENEYDFKKICQNNPLNKIFLISVEDDEEFILKEIYNPNFYMKRKMRRIVMRMEKVEEMISKAPRERFIFFGENKTIKDLEKEKLNIFHLTPEQHKKSKKFSEDLKINTHQFEVENGSLIWIDSSLSVEKIRKYVNTNKEYLTDEENVIEFMANKKLVIIADEPGMGKSTTVTKMCESKSITGKFWIIRVNLKDRLQVIEKLKTNNFKLKSIIKTLEEFESKSYDDVNYFFLELMLNPEKNFSKYLLLVFDGFDELLDEDHRTVTLHLFKFLKEKTKSRIWITSRLHFKTLLEDELNTFSLQLHPMQEKIKKKEYIKKYYKDRLNLILNESFYSDKVFEGSKLETYVEKLISKMESIFPENISSIIGTPLQLNLMLDNSTNYFKYWVENEGIDLDFIYLGNNLFQVYEKYIDRKYDIYFKKNNTFIRGSSGKY